MSRPRDELGIRLERSPPLSKPISMKGRAMPQQPNDAKLRELILYIARKSEKDPNFGATKLNKLLFYSDFTAFGMFGNPITGQEYQKLPQGPCPRRLIPIQEELLSAGDLVIEQRPVYTKMQRRPIAVRDPDLSLFDPEELKQVDKILALFAGLNATQISDKSHGFMGWALAEDKETIPYEVGLVGMRKPNEQEKAWGRELAELAGACLANEA